MLRWTEQMLEKPTCSIVLRWESAHNVYGFNRD